jgi:hypothetical protein
MVSSWVRRLVALTGRSEPILRIRHRVRFFLLRFAARVQRGCYTWKIMRFWCGLLLWALCSCGGRETFDSGAASDAGSMGASDAGSMGASADAADTGALDEASRPSAQRCGAASATTPPLTTTARPAVVLMRLEQFLSGMASPVGQLPVPPSVTAEWAAATATQLLDRVIASDADAPAGFVRWLAKWNYDGSTPASAPRWARAIAQPSADLATLIARPNPDTVRGIGYMTDKEILAGRPSIDRRGTLVLGQLLCVDVPQPSVTFPDPMPMPDETEREAHERATALPMCRSCHQLFDPFGHAFDYFDRSGQYRELDNGLLVNASDEFDEVPGTSFKFNSLDDLAPQLAQSCEVARCVSAKLLREAIAPNAGQTEDLPFSEQEVDAIAQAFFASNFSFRALVRAIVTSPAFLR